MEKSLLFLFFYLTNKQYIVFTIYYACTQNWVKFSLESHLNSKKKTWFHDVFPLFFEWESSSLYWNHREWHENKDKCFVHPIFLSLGFWYFGHFSCVIFFPFFLSCPSCLAKCKQSLHKIFVFCNFVAQTDQKPKTKFGMNET